MTMTTDTTTLLQQLTLEEKAALCVGISPWQTYAIERLGIPSISVSDGPHGVRRTPDMASDSLPATCFPTASALASSWDVDLVFEMGQALADECIALGVDVLLGPGNNMKRTPLCGRNFEYFAEDPVLGGEMAAALINGIQSKGVGTSLKHYAVNNQETERMTISASVEPRALHEIYLAGFERAIRKANPWTVMCAYNRINGTYASEHRQLLTDILRTQWGYEGVVVSDWGAVHDRVKALDAGLDLEMPGPQNHRVRLVVEAVQKGTLDAAALDRAAGRILDLVAKAQQTPKGHTTIDVDAHHALARRVAAETIVLLKNEGNLLPLKDIAMLAVIGVSAQQPHFQGEGSSHINPTRVDVPYAELLTGGDHEQTYEPGYTMDDVFDQTLIDRAVAIAADADVALLFIALPAFKEAEGYDRPDMDLTAQQVALIKAVAKAQPRCVVILNNGSPVTMHNWIDDVPAVLEAWMMGQAGGGAINDVLLGRVNPSGRLAETFPMHLSDTPAYLNFPGERGQVTYGEGQFIGYRYYDARQAAVQFPFGFGLSYTTFSMSNLRLSHSAIREGDALTVTVDVTNTGSMAGKETVQVYVRDVESSLVRPVKELAGFAKVSLAAGQTKSVAIELESSAFDFYDPALGAWAAESGAFEVLVGHSAADITLRDTVMLEAQPRAARPLHRFSTLQELMADPRGEAVIRPRLLTLFKTVTTPEGEEVPLPETLWWAKGLPLETLLIWFGNDLPLAPELLVDQLLAEIRALS
jgi:beta-glucosidase